MKKITYIQFTDPAAYPPIEHSAILLAEHGWEVLLLGATSAIDGRLEFAAAPHIRVHKIRLDRRLLLKTRYGFFLIWCIFRVWWWRPHWIYASDPLSTPVAWCLRKLFKLRVVYHEHDSPDLSHAVTSSMRKVMEFRSALALDADLCILPQHQRLMQFVADTGRVGPTYCVWNCPLSREAQKDIGPTHRTLKEPLIIYYHGSISADRLPRQLIDAALKFKGRVKVRIAGYETIGSAGYIESLQRLAVSDGTPNVIEWLGAISARDELLQIASSSHVGISLMPREARDINMRFMAGASNKPFDYMACGLPLLVSRLQDWEKMFVEPGYARACDPLDAGSIEQELEWYLENPDLRQAMGRSARAKINDDWNYERTFAGVMKTLNES